MRFRNMKCKNCGSDQFEMVSQGYFSGIYCKKCGRLLQWVKFEKRKQVAGFFKRYGDYKEIDEDYKEIK